MKAVHLRTNYRKNPLGIENDSLRFTWNCEGGIEQKAYQVIITDEDGKNLYDSGRVETGHMYCEPKGLCLKSRQRMSWAVRLWDERGGQELSAPAWFEIGLASGDWKAKWISTGQKAGKERLPGEYFRKAFSLRGKVKKARLYATACGVYTAWINGRRLPGVMAPGSTEYPKRLYYHTYDVTELLQAENTLSFTLMDGWYMGKLGYLNVTNRFGNMRKLLAQLEIEMEDGRKELICTDEDFSCSWDGPVRYADLKDGEVYDSRMVPTYNERPIIAEHSVLPTASPSDMIEEQERFPGTLIRTPAGKKVLDFGQNLAGYVCFWVRGKAGQEIRISLGEVLDHGEFSRATLIEKGRPEIRQEIVFICNGERQFFQPEGFYSGFRYALMEGLEEVVPEDFEAVAVYSKMDFVGEFVCSNPKINRFYQNTLWSLKSNFVDVPTDCPQREKSGWDGDAQIFLPTACYMADVGAFFRKWLRDMRDCQRKDGRVANVSPSAHKYQDREPLSGAVGWADAAVIIPYTLWKLYGDERFISENLDLMLGWKDYVRRAARNKTMKRLSIFPPVNRIFGPYYVKKSPLEGYVIESGMHWGEWMEPDIDSLAEQREPKPELTAAYTHYSMRLLAEMLEAAGRREEAEECRAFSEKAKEAYRFYFAKNGHIEIPGKNTLPVRQAPMVRALALGLLDGETEKAVAADLNQSAIKREYTVGTGFLSTPYVLEVLTKYGYLDTAYKMLENTKAPGWLAMVEGGATTVWETYVMYDSEGHPLGHSMNHYSPGAVCAFLFHTVCGIRMDGERHFVVAPLPGGTLEHARARYRSPYGEVSCRWERKEDERIFYHVEVPANCTAAVCLPGGRVENVCTGTYEFTE